MRKSRSSEEQIIGVLKEHQAGLPVAELCRKHGISDGTFYAWRSKYGGMETSDARRRKALEEENRKLKKLLTENNNGAGSARSPMRRQRWPPSRAGSTTTTSSILTAGSNTAHQESTSEPSRNPPRVRSDGGNSSGGRSPRRHSCAKVAAGHTWRQLEFDTAQRRETLADALRQRSPRCRLGAG